MPKIHISDNVNGRSKIDRYGWTVKDKPGELIFINKYSLNIDLEYQRDANSKKITDLASSWSWIAAGAIIVGKRSGKYYVIDGQHRVLASQKRSDISDLPCLVFETSDVVQEAVGFLDLNTNRRPLEMIARFRALISSGNQTAIFVDKTLTQHGVEWRKDQGKGSCIRCLGWCMLAAEKNKDRFAKVIRVMTETCPGQTIHERVSSSLFYLDETLNVSIDDERFKSRLRLIGESALLKATYKASELYQKGGSKIWATGVLIEINKGLRNRFEKRIED